MPCQGLGNRLSWNLPSRVLGDDLGKLVGFKYHRAAVLDDRHVVIALPAEPPDAGAVGRRDIGRFERHAGVFQDAALDQTCNVEDKKLFDLIKLYRDIHSWISKYLPATSNIGPRTCSSLKFFSPIHRSYFCGLWLRAHRNSYYSGIYLYLGEQLLWSAGFKYFRGINRQTYFGSWI